MTPEEKELFENSVSIDCMQKNEIYMNASRRFNTVLSEIERKLPEKDKKLILQLIYNRAVLETVIGDEMYKKGKDTI